MQPSVPSVLDFLTLLFDQGHGYSVLNTARCALSQIIVWNDRYTIGSHPLVVKFLKAVYNLRPPVSRYTDTWDVVRLLTQIESMEPLGELTLKHLTFKTVALIAIVAATRQTLVSLDIQNLVTKNNAHCFTIGKTDLKQSRPGFIPQQIELKAYTEDRRKCVYRAVTEYLSRTEDIRGQETQVFISYNKPHRKVTSSTIGRWLKTIMAMAGIDVKTYRPHSIRAASMSKAFTAGVPISDILKTAGWANAKTFARFYNKPIIPESTFSERVLEI